MEVLITVPKGKLLLERNIRHTSHGKCMGDVRAGNSHHQVVIQTSRQQSKYATGLLCIILKFSMCTPWTPPIQCLGGMQKSTEFHFYVHCLLLCGFSNLFILTPCMPHYWCLLEVVLQSFCFHVCSYFCHPYLPLYFYFCFLFFFFLDILTSVWSWVQ